MISIVDPEQFKNVLRPTVYAAAVDALRSRFNGGATSSERARGWSDDSRHEGERGADALAVEAVSVSQHS
jgi:hypothetical protein